MATTLASLDPIMKEVYAPRISEQLNQETTALKRITRSNSGVTQDVGGKYVVLPIHTRRNAGIGSRLESEALPQPGQQGYAASRVALKYGYGSIQLTGQAIALSDSDSKSFARALDKEMTGVKNDILKDMNRQVYGVGNGAIGTVSSAGSASTTITVSDARLFQVGEVVDLITLPATVAQAGLTVTQVNVGAGTIVVSSAVTSAVGQILVRTGSGPSASANRELTGLAAIVNNTGVLFNVDPSVEPEWTATVNANGGTPRALTEALMINVVDTIRTRGGSTSLILTSLGVRRAYFNLLSQTRQTVNTQEFTGGFKGLSFTTDKGDIPFIADVDAPLSKAWFIEEDTFTYYHDEDWHWLDRSGNMWERKVDASGTYDAWYANLVEYHELATDRRNSNGLLADITEA